MFTQRELDNYAGPVYRKGLEEGVKKGIEQGAAQRNLEIARAMLSDHVDIKTVAKYSGISEDELKKISSQT